MSTRSYIAMEIDNGSYKTIYCHSDGYLTHNGAMLLDHYSDRQKLDELLELGNIAFLALNVHPTTKTHGFDYDKREPNVVVAYKRDRGEKNQEAQIYTLDNMPEGWIEYVYLFTKDNKWKYFTNFDKKEIKDVAEDLAREYEQMGISRPPNEYGFLTQKDLDEIKSKQVKLNNDEDEM